MAFLKPQSPLTKGNDYFYPLTTADQVIMQGGYRLDQIVGAVEKSTITLYANGWSAEAPYSQSIVVEGLDDNLNMKMLPHFPEDFEGKQAMKEETAKISFASRNGSILTFECWDEVPTIDIPVDIEINVLYPLEAAIDMSEIESRLPQINYSVVGGTEEPSNPTENMIWVNTDQEITDYIFSKNEPKNSIEGIVWIVTGNNSNVSFHNLIINEKEYDEIHPVFAKQYLGGVWVDKTAKSYQGGLWVDWIPEGALYYNGNEMSEKTGGWSAVAWVPNTNYTNVGLTFDKNEDHMSLGFSNQTAKGRDWCIYSNNKIDMSKYNTLCIDAEHSFNGTKFGLSSVKPTSSTAVSWVVSQAFSTQTNRGETTLDVSDCDSSYYVVVWAYDDSKTSANINVYEIVAE